MPITIDDAFIDKFNADVHVAYQQMMSKLRGTVRTDADVRASKVRFQKLGVITTTTKGRNGEIPPTNPEHTWVEATMADSYALIYVDQLDLTKLNIEIRGNYVTEMAAAFARETDDIIIDAMAAGATQTVGTGYGGAMTRNLALEAVELLDVNEVPNDGNVYCAITPRQWAHLMTVEEFQNSDYNGPDLPFTKRQDVRTWYGVHWMKHNRLPGARTANCDCYMWHRSALGHGINAEVDITWDWENPRKAWSAAGSMSMGATTIDANGFIEIQVDDTAALP
jgi:hypothetical protein